MQNWSVDKIIAVGLMGAFVITVITMDISAVIRGDMELGAIAKELAIGLFSYMGRGLTSSQQPAQQTSQPQSQVSQTLGKVSETASQAQSIVNAAEAIHDVLKPKK